MLKTLIKFKNGKPFISIDGELQYPLAYTSYFEECGEYSDFIKSGYKMFFINVSFTDLPINNVTGFTPFLTGVFEGKEPQYTEFDNTVNRILSRCPDALIFPRINIAMPRKWIENNTFECVKTPTGMRESLCSEKFLHDGAELLKTLVLHIRSSDYKDRIAGYQLCGGTTQEWMHHDLFGSFSDMGLKKFRTWMLENYGIENAAIPSRELFTKGIVNETTRRYAEFSNKVVAAAINHFAKVLKEFINNEQIVGAFYGYSAFVGNTLFGLHGLHHIIDSPYIDFFSSPCAYDNTRQLGVDWGDMIPVDSLKLHGKLAFIECDIRTHLTRRMQDSRPGQYPDDAYALRDANGNKTVWCGPETLDLSLSALRKAFTHQLTKSSAVWWFDMWGGWYHDDKIMDEIKLMKAIADCSVNKNSADYPDSQVVLFVDEKAYANIPYSNSLDRTVSDTRVAMGNTGIPFDIFMIEDFSDVINRYKAAIFTSPIPSDSGNKAIKMCKEMNLPYITITEEKTSFSTDELRQFLMQYGIHCYNADGNVVYCGKGFVGIHAVNDGEITISLPKKYKLKPLLGEISPECETDKLLLNMKKYDTAVFELIKGQMY
ncbi:MAG: hypothetical protein IKL10_05285 [Clostridia bacterium]|nr:hypothetical protein [Clostridia bacterium]